MTTPEIAAFFDEATFTASYVVADAATGHCAIVDSVMGFDPASGRRSTEPADAVVDHVRGRGLTVDWILETHVHADHLSAAAYLKKQLGGRIGIGAHIADVQAVFKSIYNAEPGFATDGRQFDRLFADGDRFAIGGLEATVMHTPGHTPACVTYLVGDAAFVGDTLFMPDFGTARCDFPGGDPATLYRSIRKILALPPETRLFVCHDYKASGRDQFAWETTIAEQRANNPHIRDGIEEAAFVKMRTKRDRTLAMPSLLLPSIQVNMRAGELPPPEGNGVSYLKLPVDRF
ncbi:MAG: MBL fold metallo-hydrolase [Inquilinus sp.]|nr:MBL fold metallo-hydrolase [Inquilinus sp.]